MNTTSRLKASVKKSICRKGREVFEPIPALIFGSLAVTSEWQIIHVQSGRLVPTPYTKTLSLIQIARLARDLDAAHRYELDLLGMMPVTSLLAPIDTPQVRALTKPIVAFVKAWVERVD